MAMIATNTTASQLNIVVLAAGFSSRLGQPKALARIHGVSLLSRTLQLAAALRPARIVVVVPPAADRYRAQTRLRHVDFVRNPRRKQGLSSSVRCGVRSARYGYAVLLLPVDLAGLELRDLQRLVRRWRAAPVRTYATRVDARGGAPVILPNRLFPRALRIAGDTGLRALLAELPAEQRVLVELPSAGFDVDTAGDLAAARSRWR
jgi:molybdenum cofactor cytidylyltransferase